MTPENILNSLAPMVKLNQWARLSFTEQGPMYRAASFIYKMKSIIIESALEQGMCQWRIVAVERPCKTCDPKCPGQFKRYFRNWGDEDEWEYEDCRRCSGSGRVTLKFLETAIAGVVWHTPQPKASFFGANAEEWEKAKATAWTPEQPGSPLALRSLIKLLNDAEREVFAGRRICYPVSYGRPNYSLYLGNYRQCFVCAAVDARPDEYLPDISSPGLEWKQFVCFECADRAMRWPSRWPYNLEKPSRGNGVDWYPRWFKRAPLPALANDPIVEEWLQRRGIRIGHVPPGEYAFHRGVLVRVKSQLADGSCLICSLLPAFIDVELPTTVASAELRGWCAPMIEGRREN